MSRFALLFSLSILAGADALAQARPALDRLSGSRQVPINKCWVRTSEEIANALGVPCKICIDTLQVTTILGRTPKVVLASPQIPGNYELQVSEIPGRLKATFWGFDVDEPTVCERRQGFDKMVVTRPGRASGVKFTFDLSYEGEYLGNLEIEGTSLTSGYVGSLSQLAYSCSIPESDKVKRRVVFWEADGGSNCPR
jgi:hypothetical protein